VKQPMWIINSSVLLLLIVLELMVCLFHVSAPRSVSLALSPVGQAATIVKQTIDIDQIYETNDIFNTYIDTATTNPFIQSPELIIPSAPLAIPVSIPEIAQPTFVAPLDVTLKGVMFLPDDQLNSVVVVQSSSMQVDYRVGDFIEDAQVLKIFPDKVLVIRSSGQQEMLYLREEDAAQDLQFEDTLVMQPSIVFEIQDGVYSINVAKFVRKLSNLGQLIDALGLVTVYNQGQASGCRVGQASDGTIGAALGLQEGDIITTIENIAINDLASRIAAYNAVIAKTAGETVAITVQRNGSAYSILYNLVDESKAKVLANKYDISAGQSSTVSTDDLIDTLSQSDYEIEKQRMGILSRKVVMAPTQQQIQEQELEKLLRTIRK
jgi:type II secretion system protein C